MKVLFRKVTQGVSDWVQLFRFAVSRKPILVGPVIEGELSPTKAAAAALSMQAKHLTGELGATREDVMSRDSFAKIESDFLQLREDSLRENGFDVSILNPDRGSSEVERFASVFELNNDDALRILNYKPDSK